MFLNNHPNLVHLALTVAPGFISFGEDNWEPLSNAAPPLPFLTTFEGRLSLLEVLLNGHTPPVLMHLYLEDAQPLLENGDSACKWARALSPIIANLVFLDLALPAEEPLVAVVLLLRCGSPMRLSDLRIMGGGPVLTLEVRSYSSSLCGAERSCRLSPFDLHRLSRSFGASASGAWLHGSPWPVSCTTRSGLRSPSWTGSPPSCLCSSVRIPHHDSPPRLTVIRTDQSVWSVSNSLVIPRTQDEGEGISTSLNFDLGNM